MTVKVDAKAIVNIGIPIQRAEGLDGRQLTPVEKTKVPIPDGLTYVMVDRQAISNKMQTVTAAQRIFAATKRKDRTLLPAAPIVVRFQYENKLVDAKTQGYHLHALPEGPLSVTYRVFNLDDHPHDVTLTLNCVEAPRIVAGQKELAVHLNGTSHTDISWQVDVSKALAKHSHVTLYVKTRCPTTGKITPTVITMIK